MKDYKKKYLYYKLKYLDLKKKDIIKNDYVIHKKKNKIGKVIEIHNDSIPVYYTVKFNDNSEVQTIYEKIVKYNMS